MRRVGYQGLSRGRKPVPDLALARRSEQPSRAAERPGHVRRDVADGDHEVAGRAQARQALRGRCTGPRRPDASIRAGRRFRTSSRALRCRHTARSTNRTPRHPQHVPHSASALLFCGAEFPVCAAPGNADDSGSQHPREIGARYTSSAPRIRLEDSLSCRGKLSNEGRSHRPRLPNGTWQS